MRDELHVGTKVAPKIIKKAQTTYRDHCFFMILGYTWAPKRKKSLIFVKCWDFHPCSWKGVKIRTFPQNEPLPAFGGQSGSQNHQETVIPVRGWRLFDDFGSHFGPQMQKVSHFGEMLGFSPISMKMGGNPNISPKWETFCVWGPKWLQKSSRNRDPYKGLVPRGRKCTHFTKTECI